MEVTFKRHYEMIKLYINGHLHLQLKLLDLVGFQTWVHGEGEHFIEYYFSTGNKVTSVYENKELWSTILDILDKHLLPNGN